MPLAKTWARFRRWLHLTNYLLTLPFKLFVGWLTDPGTRYEVHRATDLSTPNTFIVYKKSVTLHEIVQLGCTYGKVFWRKEGSHG